MGQICIMQRSTFARYAAIGALVFSLAAFNSCSTAKEATVAKKPPIAKKAPEKKPPLKSGRMGMPKPSASVMAIEQKIHALINVERRKNGLSPLKYNETLSDVARGHSIDMDEKNYFSHEGSDGSSPDERIKSVGYNCLKVGNFNTDGENIARISDGTTMSVASGKGGARQSLLDKIAANFVRAWMKSPGHRANILNSEFGVEGVGVFLDSHGTAYATQNFSNCDLNLSDSPGITSSGSNDSKKKNAAAGKIMRPQKK